MKNEETIKLKVELSTPFGKKFQDNIFGLQHFMQFANVVPVIEPLLRGFSQTIKLNKTNFNLNEVIGEIKDIDDQKPREITLGETVDLLEEQMNVLKDVENKFYEIKLSERIFAYYIFSLTAYSDAYCSDLVDYIFTISSKSYIRKWSKEFDRNINSLEKFQKIIKSFREKVKVTSNQIIDISKITESEDFKEIRETFRILIKLRNDVAHKSPETKLDNLYRRFFHITTFYGDNMKILEKPVFDNNVELSNYTEIQLIELQLKTLRSVGYQILKFVAYIESLVMYLLRLTEAETEGQ